MVRPRWGALRTPVSITPLRFPGMTAYRFEPVKFGTVGEVSFAPVQLFDRARERAQRKITLLLGAREASALPQGTGPGAFP
jgi:hypothetical protein